MSVWCCWLILILNRRGNNKIMSTSKSLEIHVIKELKVWSILVLLEQRANLVSQLILILDQTKRSTQTHILNSYIVLYKILKHLRRVKLTYRSWTPNIHIAISHKTTREITSTQLIDFNIILWVDGNLREHIKFIDWLTLA